MTPFWKLGHFFSMLVVCMDCLPRAFRLQIRKGIGLVQHPRGLICLKRFVQRRHRASFVQPVSAEEILSRVCNISSSEMLRIQSLPQKLPNDPQTPHPEWIEARRFRLTASRFGAAAGHDRYTSPKKLVRSMLIHEKITGPALDWGNVHEKDAEKSYISRKMSEIDNRKKINPKLGSIQGRDCFKIDHPGLVIHPSLPWLAASPDGSVTEKIPNFSVFSQEKGIAFSGETESKHGIVEYKCPYSQRLRPVDVSVPFYKNERQANGITAPIPPHYFDQIQGTMAVTGRQWCDFVVWTPTQTQVSRYYFDKKYWDNVLLPSLKSFYFDLFLPVAVVAENEGVEAALNRFDL